ARSGRVVSDATITRGGCLVESDIGVIDASVEARWRRAAASIGCNDAWQESSSMSVADIEQQLAAEDEEPRT
ncbi:MAG TPA: FliH/SctL family protein, partial [Rubrivivax sp.]|nr:FliH/SctL family protein [Rubrivivax sp.]